MKSHKLILLLSTIFGFAQCNTLKLADNPPFKITSSTYNNWTGVKPGISGIKVNIGYQSEDKIIFDKIYFHNKIARIETRIIKERKYIIGYFNTSIREYDVFIENENTPENEIVNTADFPFKLKENEAVISFKKGDKTKYYKVTGIEKLSN